MECRPDNSSERSVVLEDSVWKDGLDGPGLWIAHTTSTMAPITNDTIVLQDDQGYIEPAEVSGNENAVLPTAKRNIPIQFKRRSLERDDWSIGRRWRKKKLRPKATATIGRLIQLIHLQDTNWLSAAPITGPHIPPPAMGNENRPRYSGRSFSVVRSASITSPRTSNPPPPSPCRMRPQSTIDMVFATAKTMEPAKKKKKTMFSGILRPRTSLTLIYIGCVTTRAQMNEILIQNASRVIPYRSIVIFCRKSKHQLEGIFLFGREWLQWNKQV